MQRSGQDTDTSKMCLSAAPFTKDDVNPPAKQHCKLGYVKVKNISGETKPQDSCYSQEMPRFQKNKFCAHKIKNYCVARSKIVNTVFRDASNIHDSHQANTNCCITSDICPCVNKTNTNIGCKYLNSQMRVNPYNVEEIDNNMHISDEDLPCSRKSKLAYISEEKLSGAVERKQQDIKDKTQHYTSKVHKDRRHQDCSLPTQNLWSRNSCQGSGPLRLERQNTSSALPAEFSMNSTKMFMLSLILLTSATIGEWNNFINFDVT